MDSLSARPGFCSTDVTGFHFNNRSGTAADCADPSRFAAVSSNYPITVLFTVLLVYAAICSSLRFRHEKAMLRRFNYPDRASLANMTSNDAQSILAYIMSYEFPFIYKTALQFAIFKVGEYHHEQRRGTAGLTHGRHTASNPCLDLSWRPRASLTPRLHQRGIVLLGTMGCVWWHVQS